MRPNFTFVCALSLMVPGMLPAQFAPGILLPAAPEMDLHAVDLDGDGDLDLAGVFQGHRLIGLFNLDGSGNFSPPLELADLAGNVLHLAFADVDLDGLTDVIYVSLDGEDVHIVMNEGAGQFGQAGNVLMLPDAPAALACRDINGNGYPDIVLTMPSVGGGTFAWSANAGGNFADLEWAAAQFEGQASPVLLIGDMDLVGGNDLVFLDGNGMLLGARNVLGNASEWNVDTLVAFAFPAFTRPALLDVDQDSALDVVEAHDGVVRWARNPLGEGGQWSMFTDRVLTTGPQAGPGFFGHIGCQGGMVAVYVPTDEDQPVQWTAYLDTLHAFAHRTQVPEVPRGEAQLMADLNGDGQQDFLMRRPDGLYLHAANVLPGSYELVLPELEPYCLFGPPLPLPEVVAGNARWNGPWVIDGLFHRANMGIPGAVPLDYVYYEPGHCPVGASQDVQLLNGPLVSPSLTGVICVDGPIQLSAEPADVTWYGIAADGILDPSTYDGSPIACAWTDGTGMECASVSGPLFLWAKVPVSIEEAGPFCVNDGPMTIQAAVLPPQGGTWSGDILSDLGSTALFDPSLGAGTYQIILDVQPGGPQQCPNSDTLLVQVIDDIPVIVLPKLSAYCASGVPIDLSSAQPEGGQWSGPGLVGTMVDPLAAGPGPHTFTYTATSPGGCSATETLLLELFDQAQVTWSGGGPVICTTAGPVLFTGSPAGGTWEEPLVASGILDPSSLGAGQFTILYTYTDPAGCVLTNAPLEVELRDPALVSIEPVQTLCLSWDPVELIGSEAGLWSGAVSGEGATLLFDPLTLGQGTWTVILTAPLGGYCPGTATVDVVVDACAGMSEMGENGLTFMPNPFLDQATIQVGSLPVEALMVLDGTGRPIWSAGPQPAHTRMDLDLSVAAPGAYLLRLEDQDGTIRTSRLIKL